MDGIAMTADELQSLRTELGELETDGRAQIAQRIKTAREWGDLKENGEYHAAKEAQAHLETRIQRLREQVRGAVVVQTSESGGQVSHGATVEVTDLGKESTQTFKIVSQHDAKPKEGLISSTSPVAQALIGHQLGDVVEIQIPAGVRRLRIDKIA
jgi:transcription elongation factor GreA